MKIEFELVELGETEAAALIALLSVAYPKASAKAGLLASVRMGDLEISGGADFVTATVNDVNAAEAFSAEKVPEAAQAFATAPMPEVMPPEAGAPFAASVTEAAGSGEAGTLAPVPASAGVSADRDATGLPWDARIHATGEGGGGVKTKEGKWRAKRKVDDAVVASVTAELRAAVGAAPAPQAQAAAPATPPPPPPPPAAPPVTAPTAVQPAETAPQDSPVSAAPVSPASPAPAAASPAPSPPPPPPPTVEAPAAPNPTAEFARIMRKVTEAQAAGKISPEDTATLVAGCGLTHLKDLIANPGQVKTFEDAFDAWVS